MLLQPSWFNNSIRIVPCFFFPAGIWILLAGRVLSSTCTMDWLCLSDGWYGLQAALLNLNLCPSFFFWQNLCLQSSKHSCLFICVIAPPPMSDAADCSDHTVRLLLHPHVPSLRSGNPLLQLVILSSCSSSVISKRK